MVSRFSMIALVTALLSFTLLSECVAAPLVPARGRAPISEVTLTPDLGKRLREMPCDWKAGAEVLNDSRNLRNMLARVAELDWYFGGELIRETQFMRWCMTDTALPGGISRHGNSLTNLLRGKQSVVYRYLDTAYVDLRSFRELDDRTRSWFLLHAVIQSYFAPHDSRRKVKVAGTLSILTRVEKLSIRSRAALHAGLKQQGVLFPFTTRLDPYRAQVEFATGSEIQQARSILKSARPENLIAFPAAAQKFLSDWDYSLLRPLDELFMSALESVVSDVSTESYRALFTDSRFKSTQLAQASLNVLDELASEKRAFLFAQSVWRDIIDHQMAAFSAARVSFSRGKPMASPFLQSLGMMPAERSASELSDVLPRRIGEDQMPLPEAVKTFVKSVAILAREGEWREIEDLFTGNEKFYSALGLKEAMQSLRQAGHEKGLLQLAQVREGLLAKFFDEVSRKLSDDAREELYRRIQFDRFQ